MNMTNPQRTQKGEPMDKDQPEIRRSHALEQRTAPAVEPMAKKLKKTRPKSKLLTEGEASGPVAELRRIVGLHKNLAADIQRLGHMIKDRKFEDGVRPHGKSDAVVLDVKRSIATMTADQGDLVKKMLKELNTIPIYQLFLSQVYGAGTVTSAYLVAMVRIERCPNVSNLIRYCGNAPDYRDGWRENRSASPKYDADGKFTPGVGTFNSDLRRNNWLIMKCMRQNAAKVSADRPFGTTSKYLDRWLEASHSERTMPAPARPHPSGKARAPIPDAKGRMKATDLLLWDLYVVWRAISGLDMRYDKFSVARGRDHQGNEIRHDVRFTLSVEEALDLVGDVSGRPATTKAEWKAPIDADDDE
jgi:hypothetical protein